MSDRFERRGVSRLAVALVVCLVLLAGCSGFAGGDESPDREPYGVEEPVNASVEDEPEELVPGLTTEEVTDPDALLEAHHEATDGASYTIETETVYATETENETVRQVIEGETYVDPEAGAVHQVHHQYTEGNGSDGLLPDQQNRTVERWFGEESLYRVELENGSVEYPYAGDIDAMEWVESSLLGHMELFDTTTAGGVDTEDGTYYVIEGTENRSDGIGEDREAESRTLVREDGLVRQTVIEEVFTQGDERTVANSSSEIAAVSETTVERPDWYEEAVEAQPDEPDMAGPNGGDGPDEQTGNESADGEPPAGSDAEGGDSSG